MNKQRKVLITITYNEMGIIIDTKAEEVAQQNLQPTCNQLATDCISRQAAIDAIQKNIDEMNHNQKYHADAVRLNGDLIIHGLEIAISAVKSVQPTHETPSNMLKSLDCVDRQAAIDAIYRCANIFITNLPVMADKADAYKALAKLPAVQPERKPGRWTHAWGTDDGIWKCSECGFEIDAHGCVDPVEYLETYKFCPNCGSDNREEGDRT